MVTDLPDDLRDSIGLAFRELLLNAVEWGGKLDPNRKVRIAYVRSSRMLLYRIADPGAGFSFQGLAHAAAGHSPDEPVAHVAVREQLGIADTYKLLFGISFGYEDQDVKANAARVDRAGIDDVVRFHR